MQYVKIDLNGRAYTYAWAGEKPLQVGEWVVVPGNSYNPDPSTGRVLRLLAKCDFTGKVTVLRQRIDMSKPTQVQANRAPKSMPKPYDDNVLGQESGPIAEAFEDFDAEDAFERRAQAADDYGFGGWGTEHI